MTKSLSLYLSYYSLTVINDYVTIFRDDIIDLFLSPELTKLLIGLIRTYYVMITLVLQIIYKIVNKFFGDFKRGSFKLITSINILRGKFKHFIIHIFLTFFISSILSSFFTSEAPSVDNKYKLFNLLLFCFF